MIDTLFRWVVTDREVLAERVRQIRSGDQYFAALSKRKVVRD